MPELRITIGGRHFEVACQDGEQPYLQSAAGLLDAEAQAMADQLGRMPEARMLLMAGLMLADRTAGLAEEVERLRQELREYQGMPAPVPERVEVPVIPASLRDGLAELAARAEALAEELEEEQG
ncbi:MAG: cell division protein ZapA [Qingshengfaniella sp.]